MRDVLAIVALLFFSACAHRGQVAEDYSRVLEQNPNPSAHPMTVFFLVDGLSRSQLAATELPQIDHHFAIRSVAYTSFPSLTFPSIASLLTESPVHKTGAIGNQLLKGGRVIDFDNPLEREAFNALIRGDNIFTRLRAKGLRSVSLDYGLGSDADVSVQLGPLTGLSLLNEDYLRLDKERLDALYRLLRGTPVNLWPDFVFVHLVGLDFLTHSHGPHSKLAKRYLQRLDRELGRVLALLREAERQRHIVTMLSSDHGFDETIKRHLAIEEVVSRFDPNILVLSQGRMAALYLPKQIHRLRLASYLQRQSQVEYIAWMQQGQIKVVAPTGEPWPPFFQENLVRYFKAAKAPEMVVIPRSGTSFKGDWRGHHGGPTANEVLVPLLLRNHALKPSNRPPALWDLLGYM